MARVTYFKHIAYGIRTILLGLIPVTLAILCFQILIDVRPYQKELRSLVLASGYNFKMLIYYIVAGFAHIVVCSVVIYHFLLTNKRNIPGITLSLVRRVRLVMVFGIFGLVFLMDAIHINIAFFSHDRLYIIISQTPFFSAAMKFFPSDFIPFLQFRWFHLFSIYPFILICFALSVMVYGGFYIGKELNALFGQSDNNKEKIKQYISQVNGTLKKYAQLLSIVLVSSTVATVLFFQVPVSLIKDQNMRDDYSSVSMSMGICWGVIFSLTLLFLCIYPYWLAHKKITELIQEKRVQDDTELENWLDSNRSLYSVMGNMKLIISVISPAAASIVTTIVTKGL